MASTGSYERCVLDLSLLVLYIDNQVSGPRSSRIQRNLNLILANHARTYWAFGLRASERSKWAPASSPDRPTRISVQGTRR